MRFYQFVLKNVFRRRVRSALTVTGMAMAVGAVVAFVGIADGFTKSFMEIYQNRDVDLIVSCKGGTQILNGVMPQEVGPKIAALDGVAAVAPGLVDIVNIEELGIYGKILQGWPLESFMYQEIKPIQGERLSEKYRGKRSIMLGKNLAEQMKVKIGDKVALREGDEFTVVCIYETSNAIENDGIVMLLEDARPS